MNAQLRPATLTESELKATIYFAVGVASEGSLRGRNVAYDLAFAGYIHREGDTVRGQPREAGVFRERQLGPIYNSGYSIGTLQTDFGQQRNDPDRNADGLLDAYQTWACQPGRRAGLALTQDEYDQASEALRRQGNEIRGNRQTVTDNGYDVPAGIKNRLNEFLRSNEGITFVHDQDVRQVNHLLREDGPVRRLENTDLYTGASAEDQVRMVTVMAKLTNQAGDESGRRVVERIERGAIDSLEDLKAAVPLNLQGDRDNALRGAELVISLRDLEVRNPLRGAWQSVMADPLVNPTQLNQDRVHSNLQAEYSTVKNLFLLPVQGRVFVESLDAGSVLAQDVRFRGVPAGHTAGLYVSGNDFVQWNRDGHGYANIGGEWREIEYGQITRADLGNGVIELNLTSDGVVVPLLHIDPRTPGIWPEPGLPQDLPRQPGREGTSIQPFQDAQSDINFAARTSGTQAEPGSLLDRLYEAAVNKDDKAMDAALEEYGRSPAGQQFQREIAGEERLWLTELRQAELQAQLAEQQWIEQVGRRGPVMSM